MSNINKNVILPIMVSGVLMASSTQVVADEVKYKRCLQKELFSSFNVTDKQAEANCAKFKKETLPPKDPPEKFYDTITICGGDLKYSVSPDDPFGPEWEYQSARLN